MIVDSHVHVWPGSRDVPDPAVTTVSPVSHVPIEVLREYMDEYNVDRAVLVQPVFRGEDNSYVADVAAGDPARFAAVCVVDPRREGAAERLAYWVGERGCRGLRLRPKVAGEAEVFGHPTSFPLWRAARDLNIVVSVLAGPEHLPALATLAERFPEVPIVVDHLAHPDVTAGARSPGFEALLNLARFPRVYLKVSGQSYFSCEPYPYADCNDVVQAVHDRFGPHRMIWGSDFPHVLLKCGYGRAMRLPERAYPFMRPAELKLMMGENTARLYWNSRRSGRDD